MAAPLGLNLYVAAPDLGVHLWPDEDTAAVFLPTAASTHLVSALSASILLAATERAVSSHDIVVALQASGEDPAEVADADADLRIIEDTIQGLINSGFLRQYE